jgi:SOS-response transcriptional repressor LexA
MDDKWFKAQQKKVGATAEDIAARMGRSRSNVSHILTGKQRMSLEWAKAFSEVLQVPVAEVLEHAGSIDRETAQTIRPGFAESDAVAWVPGPGLGEGAATRSIAAVMGADRPGVDIWRVKSRAMQLAGYMPDDFILVDSHAAERVRPGDVVIAQIYNNATGTAATVLRRYAPPVLIGASTDPEDARVHVVDRVNVLVRGKVVASWRA